MPRKEIHNAIVTRNIEADEATTLLLRGSVFFEAPGLFKGEYPLPAEPCFPFASAPNGAGFFVVPQVGDEIEIEVSVDDPNNPDDTTDAELPEPRWRCMVYSEAADIAEEFKTHYPFRMGWKTNSGHVLMFDDLENFHELSLKHALGHILQFTDFNDKENSLVEQAARLKHADGSFLEFLNKDNGTEISMKLSHIIGNLLHWNKDGDWLTTIIKDKVEDITDNYLQSVGLDSTETIGGKKVFNITGDCDINCDNANIIAAADVNITAGGNAIIMATQIHLNGAVSPATSKNSHLGVIDLITGAQIVATTTVLLDV